MYPLSDFGEIRYDKDLRKMYLQGYLGGIPKIIGCVGAFKVHSSEAFSGIVNSWGTW